MAEPDALPLISQASSAYPNHNIRLNCLLIFLSIPQDYQLLEGREFGLVYISLLNIMFFE